MKGIAVLRILFGLVWAIDAWMKWQPAFLNGFTTYLTKALDGQPAFIQSWIGFWLTLVKMNPSVFAHAVALAESALAISLLLGGFSNLACLGGTLLTFMIWSTADGFGGPYGPGSTDIGASVIYPLVFAGLFLSSAGLCFGVDQWLTPRLGRWGFFASGRFTTSVSETTRAPHQGSTTLMMKAPSRNRRHWGSAVSALLATLIVAGALVGCSQVSMTSSTQVSTSSMAMDMDHIHHYLYVWAGDEQRKQPDRLVVVDFDQHSPTYGKVVGSVEVPGPGGINNEPHHCGMSIDMKVIACGGLLSVLRHQNGIFFFDVSNPIKPRFMFSTQTAHSSVTDAFVSLHTNGFLVTMMGSASGGTPGRVAEFNGQDQLVHEWPDNPPKDGFNPHGIDLRSDLNLMITSDFVDPASTLNVVPGNPELRGSVRVWDLRQRTIIRTITIPGAPGTMDCRLIPLDPQGRGFTAGVANGLLYLLDTQHGTARPVFDFNRIAHGASPQVMAASTDGKRLYVPLDDATGGQIAVLDISNPEHPSLLSTIEMGPGSGPHMSMLMGTGSEQQLVVSDYFLNEDTFGKVHADGDHKLHVFHLTSTGLLELDQRFEVDFNTAIPGVRLRSHGIVANMIMPGDSD